MAGPPAADGARQDNGLPRQWVNPGGYPPLDRPFPMPFFRSTLLPLLIVLLFSLALVAVTARIWLPGDMAAPAPMG